jgi:hypothetical protein
LGSLIRGLLHRIVRISNTDPATALRVPVLNADQINAVSGFVARENTSTLGIVEQRYIDAVTLARKLDEGGWRSPLGLGDSVNASNLSRKKFGDIEFKSAVEPRIVAYEAHGGVLTAGYVKDHLSSLPYVLDFRRAELEDRAAIEDWQLEVVFVAHQFRDDLPTDADVGGLPVAISYCTYKELAPDEVNDDLVDAFNEVFVSRINAMQTPHRVRQVVHDVVAGVD